MKQKKMKKIGKTRNIVPCIPILSEDTKKFKEKTKKIIGFIKIEEA